MSRTIRDTGKPLRYLVVVPAYGREHAEAIVEEQNRRGRAAYMTRVDNVFLERKRTDTKSGEIPRSTWDFYILAACAGICAAALSALLLWRLCTGP
ncbi:MAG: hypothetical protein Kow0040_14960 [Thermogutta sp.]